MERKPLITIITICFNSEKTLERTIDSVAKQQYPNIEYIIIDGGSKDNTIEIIKRRRDDIDIWISEPDNGISDAFNKGIKRAHGDIVGIINSDDGLMPGALSRLAKEYEPGIDIYIGELISRDEAQGIEHKSVSPPKKFTFMTDSHITHPSTFITKDAYDKFGLYDEKCKTAMDYDLLLRMYRGGARIKTIKYPLAFFTMSGITFSNYSKGKYDEHIYIIKKYGANGIDISKYLLKRKFKNLIIRIVGRNNISKIRAFRTKIIDSIGRKR